MSINIKFFFAVSFTLLFFNKGFAKFIPEKIYTKNILFNEGLSQCVITDIVQDKKGFIWAASNDGLNRFDGQNIKIYRHNPQDKFSISSSQIFKLYPDENNHLYLSTTNGVIIFDCEKEIMISPKSLENIHTSWVCNQSKYEIWIFDKNFGLYLVDNRDYHIIKKISINNKKYTCNTIDFLKVNDALFIVSECAEILWYDINKNIYHVYKKDSITDGTLYTGCGLDKFGNFYIVSPQSDIIYFNITKMQFSKSGLYDFSTKLIGINDVMYNPYQDILLLSSYGQGLFVFDYSKNELFQLKKNESALKISNNYPISLSLNMQGVMFIGYDGSGMDVLDPYIKKFVPTIKENIDDSKTLKFSRKIIEDDDGNLIIGTSSNGVVKYNILTGAVQFLNMKNNTNILNDFVGDIIKVGNEIWLGYNGDGIGIFNRQNFSFIKNIKVGSANKEISSSTIWSFLDDEMGNIWVGTKNNGLNKIDKTTYEVTQFTKEKYPFFEENGIRVLYKKNNVTLLIGTEKGLYSLNLLNNKINIVLNNKTNNFIDSLVSIKSIFIDKKQRVWLGTDGSGILVLSSEYKLLKNFHANNFLKNNVIYSLLPENDSSVWISTNFGLSKIIFSDNSFLEKGNIQIRNYDETNGLQSNEFNTGSYCKLKNGEFAFGGLNGLNIFNPQDVEYNTILTKVYINELKIFENDLKSEKSISYTDEINLKPFENSISIGFNTLGFSLPEKTKYQYRLIGYENEWVLTSTRNYVSYTNLHAGNYEFQVKACNYDGIWNEKYTSLKIHIQTPFYKTWWFVIGSLLILFQVAYLFYRYRMKQIKDKEELRIEYTKELAEVELKALRAQINPHFLFNSLNSINNFILKNDTKKASKYLVKFSQLVRNILNNSSNPYITLQEEIETIELYMIIEGMRFNEQFSYKINIAPDLNTGIIMTPSLLLQPYVENAIWHGLLHKEGEKLITISASYINEDSVTISIIDNGVGRKMAEEIEKQSKQRKSFGMQIGEDRLKLINKTSGQLAKVEVVDCYNEHHKAIGTEIKIIMPADILKYKN